jgi:hypothetical protein
MSTNLFKASLPTSLSRGILQKTSLYPIYDSIQFCNGCSARDTRPQKSTELYSIKLTLLDRCLLFHKLETKGTVQLSLSPGKPNSPRLLSLVDGLSQLLKYRVCFS